MTTKRQQRARAMSALAQSERPDDPMEYLSLMTRDVELEIGRLREQLRTIKLARRKLEKVLESP